MMNNVSKIGINNIIDSSVIIMENVTIGDNNKIYSGTVIYPNTKIGNNNIILNNNILGEHAVEANEVFNEKIFHGLEIGDNNVFHVGNLIFNGYYAKTIIGNNNKFLSQVTVHHDNVIHNHVVLYPRAITAGLCKLHSYSTMGMNSSLQQKSVLGAFAMIGMGSVATHNVFPFFIYVNQHYLRFNNKKIPENLQLEPYESSIRELIVDLKQNNCDDTLVSKYNLPDDITAYIYDFLNAIQIKKV